MKFLQSEIVTSEYQDKILLEKLSQPLDSCYFDNWVNYIYRHRKVPLNKIVQDLGNNIDLSKMTIDDIDETILWIKWIFSVNNQELI